MKRLTTSYKKWLQSRARSEAKRPSRRRIRSPQAHNVRAWFGEDIEDVVSESRPLVPPEIICLKTNTDETLSYIDDWQKTLRAIAPNQATENFSWFGNPKSSKGRRRIAGYTDLGEVQKYSTAAALVLTAEYDRLRIILDDVPPTINLDGWREPVFRRLYEMGFFEILGLCESVAEQYITSGDVRTMKIMTGSNSSELAAANKNILELCTFVVEQASIHENVEIALNNALSEAMVNVSKHAYREDHDLRFRHVDKWWVTASVDRVSRELTVVIYDQGASIPVTYAKKNLSQTVRDFLNNSMSSTRAFEFENDGTYIEGAMKTGKSQTDNVHRGLGLPEMKVLVDICGRGSLQIFSRGGECCYEYGKPIQRRSRETPLVAHSSSGHCISLRG